MTAMRALKPIQLDPNAPNNIMPGASKYPISQLISDIVAQHSSSETEFVRTVLGYRDLAKGTARLRGWLEDGEGPNSIIKELAWFTQRRPELEAAIAATRKVKAAEYEAAWLEQCKAEVNTFRAFLNAEGTDRIPNGICNFGATGGHRQWTMIALPDRVLELPLEGQLRVLPDYMYKYRDRYKGRVPFFGNLVGFRFARLLDHFRFDADGNFIDHGDRPFRLSTCTVRIL
jgi:hypothetical protein